MNISHIDVHGHINFPEYDADREVVISRARELGVGMVTVGVGLESSKQAIALAETHENMWAIVGIHPADVQNDTSVMTAEFEDIRELAKHQKVVAIGECGLDYFHSKPEDMAGQMELFLKHIELANKIGKPLMLHVRNGRAYKKGGVNSQTIEIEPSKISSESSGHNHSNAYQEAIDILKKHSKVPANFHFFAGNLQDAMDIVKMGNTMSFTGVLTFARNYDEIVRNIPLENMMSETDCPFVAPIPNRGKRNEPSYVIEVVKKIAEIRGEDVDKVSKKLLENAKRVFSVVKA